MIIVADSGSTKTEWALINRGQTRQVRTPGLNPFFNGPRLIEETVAGHRLLAESRHTAKQIHFYGAGCGHKENIEAMGSALQQAFPQAQVHVHSDLLGAARGLFLEEKGIAGILGTGSNSGFYNGHRITQTTPTLGYILGDEGSGNHLGKMLLKAYFHHELPQALTNQFNQQYPDSSRSLLYELYHHPYPNRFLAEFTPFIQTHQQNPYLQNLLQKAFEAYLLLLQNHYPKALLNNIRLTGSVAWAFQEKLKATARQMEMQIDRVVASPMEGLLQYHHLHQ